MIHQRKLIRDAIRAALAGNTAAEENVSTNRFNEIRPNQTAVITIYMTSEEVDPASRLSAPRELTRNANVVIECILKKRQNELVDVADGNMDDAMDAFLVQVEKAMYADETFGGTCSDCILASTEIEKLPEGDQPIIAALLTYAVRYFTYAPDEDAAELDDFVTATAEHNLGGDQHVDDRANDTLTVQESP